MLVSRVLHYGHQKGLHLLSSATSRDELQLMDLWTLLGTSSVFVEGREEQEGGRNFPTPFTASVTFLP